MRKRLPIFLIVVCAAGFVFGVVQLFKLRFESGDVYPPYSSLRADPLGTMAFYESLEKLPGISVHRDHSSANRLPEGRETSYLHLAARTREWNWLPEELWQEINRFLLDGGRLAITFHPEAAAPFRSFASPRQAANPSPPPPGGKKQKQVSGEVRSFGADSVGERWGVDFAYARLAVGDRGSYEPAEVENWSDLPLPETLAWHSATLFTNLNEAWRIIYARDAGPVVIERRFGKGSVVMATDSYFLSNEALRDDRHADFLAWFVGPSRRVIFDEAHHGIMESTGVATLIRNYRLHGLAAGLLLLAALFIWKNSSSLLPPQPDEVAAPWVAGRDATAGFVNLLRRNIPARDVLSVCFAEWTKSLYQGRYYTITAVSDARAVMEAEFKRPERQRDPVKAYQAICRTLAGSTRKTPTQKTQSRGDTSEH
ncbi:MAG: hypothetical protein KJ070_25200 [Verrucomicrobia bacterium]|nr:hypothetical protein [Verrucomicrobiota bacterium]